MLVSGDTDVAASDKWSIMFLSTLLHAVFPGCPGSLIRYCVFVMALEIAPTIQEQELCSRFLAAIRLLVNADSHLVRRARTLRTDCLVQIGATAFLLRIDGGNVRECREHLPLLCPWDFAVRGSLRAWTNLWHDPPPPGWNDLFALSKRGEMSFEGNLQPFMAHLQYVKDVLNSPRMRGE